jgi:hypothetical protein
VECPGGALRIAGCNNATGEGPGGLNRPRRGREYHPARRRPASSSFVLGRRRRPQGRLQGAGGLRALQLDPGGQAGWSRVGPTGPAQSPSWSEAAASSQGARGTGSSGERIGGRARWRRHPGRRTRWRDRAGAGGLPARRRPQQDACPWTCQRFAIAHATSALAPPHSSLRNATLELGQRCVARCRAGSREPAAPPPDTEEDGGSTPPAPTTPALSRAFGTCPSWLWMVSVGKEGSSGRAAQ